MKVHSVHATDVKRERSGFQLIYGCGREIVDINPYLLENKKIYLRYSYDDIVQLYINGKLIVSADRAAANLKVELPDSILNTMKEGKALIAAHCENKKGSALIDFGLFAEEPGILVEGIAPVSNEKEWIGKYPTEQPEEGWEMAAFNDSAWAQGSAAFGTEGGPSVRIPGIPIGYGLKGSLIRSFLSEKQTTFCALFV